MMPTHVIGLMSGTSMDGVDGVLVRFDDANFQVLAHHAAPFSPWASNCPAMRLAM